MLNSCSFTKTLQWSILGHLNNGYHYSFSSIGSELWTTLQEEQFGIFSIWKWCYASCRTEGKKITEINPWDIKIKHTQSLQWKRSTLVGIAMFPYGWEYQVTPIPLLHSHTFPIPSYKFAMSMWYSSQDFLWRKVVWMPRGYSLLVLWPSQVSLYH